MSLTLGELRDALESGLKNMPVWMFVVGVAWSYFLTWLMFRPRRGKPSR